MSKATRIEDVEFDSNGAVHVKFTRGEVPLPPTWGGESLEFASREAFAAALADAEERVSHDLGMIQCAVGYKADSTLGATFKSKVKGKTATLDLTGLTSAITLG